MASRPPNGVPGENSVGPPRSARLMYTVRDLMSTRVLYVTPGATVQAAMDLLRLQQLGVLPVVEEGRVVGLLDGITLYRYCGELPVREAMMPPLTVEADLPLGEAVSFMG